MTDHEIGMYAPVVKGLTNQCAHWREVVSDLMIEVQELKVTCSNAQDNLAAERELLNRIWEACGCPAGTDIVKYIENLKAKIGADAAHQTR